MNSISDERQREIRKYRETARRLFSEIKWIRRELPNLPFLKRHAAIRTILVLQTEARAALRKSLSLKNENL